MPAEGVEHQVMPGLSASAEIRADADVNDEAGRCGLRGLPVFVGKPAEESMPVGGGGQEAGFAGEVAGVPGGIAAKCGEADC